MSNFKAFPLCMAPALISSYISYRQPSDDLIHKNYSKRNAFIDGHNYRLKSPLVNCKRISFTLIVIN